MPQELGNWSRRSHCCVIVLAGSTLVNFQIHLPVRWLMSVEFGNRLHLFACRLQAMAVWMASAKGKLLMKRQTYATNSSQYNAHVFLALERSIERGSAWKHCRMQVPRLESRDRRRLMVATDQQQMGPQSIQKKERWLNWLRISLSLYIYMCIYICIFVSFTT